MVTKDWKRRAVALVLLALTLGLVVAVRFLPKSPPVLIKFCGYTNDPVDPTGRLLFAVFRITNSGRSLIACSHGPFEIKSAAGWARSDEYTRSYQIGSNMEPGAGMQLTLRVPASNVVWRASFQLDEMLVPTARLEWIANLLHLKVSTLQRKPMRWKVWSGELGTESY